LVAAAIEESHRVFQCAHCGSQVRICTRCDRGQRYCADGCRAIRRREAVRAAGRRYQGTAEGARNHARRQKSYRARHLPTVTHQGSLAEPLLAIRAAVVAAADAAKRKETHSDGAEEVRCDFCGCPCGPFSRFSFLWTGGFG